MNAPVAREALRCAQEKICKPEVAVADYQDTVSVLRKMARAHFRAGHNGNAVGVRYNPKTASFVIFARNSEGLVPSPGKYHRSHLMSSLYQSLERDLQISCFLEHEQCERPITTGVEYRTLSSTITIPAASLPYGATWEMELFFGQMVDKLVRRGKEVRQELRDPEIKKASERIKRAYADTVKSLTESKAVGGLDVTRPIVTGEAASLELKAA